MAPLLQRKKHSACMGAPAPYLKCAVPYFVLTYERCIYYTKRDDYTSKIFESIYIDV